MYHRETMGSRMLQSELTREQRMRCWLRAIASTSDILTTGPGSPRSVFGGIHVGYPGLPNGPSLVFIWRTQL